MNFYFLIRSAWHGLLSNKLRAALTALGVMIGVSSVIINLALGEGARSSVESSFKFLGSDQIQIMRQMRLSSDGSEKETPQLTYQDGLDMADAIPLLKGVTMQVSKTEKVRYERYSEESAVYGSTDGSMSKALLDMSFQPADWSAAQDFTDADLLAEGRWFAHAEVIQNSPVCLIGAQLAKELFGGLDVLGRTLWVNRLPCEVVGVFKEFESVKSGKRPASFNRIVYLPISTMVNNLYDEEPSVEISAQVQDEEKIDEAKNAITDFLRKKHNVVQDEEGNYEDDFTLITKKDLIGARQKAAQTFSTLLTAMALVSLSVGGIGIMNVMLVSVTERTREIGVRMAVGASKRDIILQFLLESLMLSAVSGGLGILSGIFLIPLAALLNNGIAVLSPASVPMAFFMALATGILFGLYPAFQASEMDPIVALGYE